MRRGTRLAAVAVPAVLIIAAAASLNQAQQASSGGPTRVGVLDLVEVFNKFEQTQVLNDKMNAFRLEISAEAEKRQTEVTAKQKERDAFQPDSADFKTRDKQFKEMLFAYRVWEALEQDNLANQHKMWILKTYDTINAAVQKIAASRGIQLVITTERIETAGADSKAILGQILSRKVVYADPALDITQEVLAGLNAEFKKAGGETTIKFAR